MLFLSFSLLQWLWLLARALKKPPPKLQTLPLKVQTLLPLVQKLLVMPLLQTSLIFRMLFSTWLSPEHEMVGPLVIAGVAVSITGALLVSIDTGLIVQALALPEPLSRALLWKV